MKEQNKRVVIFKETLLPPSETFVLAQAAALTRYEYKLAGLERCKRSLPIPDALVLTEHPGWVAAQRSRVYRKISWAPLFHQRIQAMKPALIHAHFASGGQTAMPLARALGVPLIVTLHGADITVRGANARYKKLAQHTALFLCVSEFIRQRALEAELPAHKLRVHYTGVDLRSFQPTHRPDTNKRVLFVGRLVEKKGCEYLIRAVAEVQRTIRGVELVIVGDGPLQAKLRGVARDLGVACEFLGVLGPERVRELMAGSAIFCAPSVRARNGDCEGLGMVFLEAAAMRLPVVSTRHGGIPEAVCDGETGLLVDERDVIALSKALSCLLENYALRARMKERALEHVTRRYDVQTQTAALEGIFDEVIASHAGA